MEWLLVEHDDNSKQRRVVVQHRHGHQIVALEILPLMMFGNEHGAVHPRVEAVVPVGIVQHHGLPVLAHPPLPWRTASRQWHIYDSQGQILALAFR